MFLPEALHTQCHKHGFMMQVERVRLYQDEINVVHECLWCFGNQSVFGVLKSSSSSSECLEEKESSMD